MMRYLKRFCRTTRREDGTASVEFVLMMPMMFTIFMASFESGLLMTRSILLEQAVDRTMRELRLGHLPNATHGSLKIEICSRTVILHECLSKIAINMQRIDTTTFAMPTTTTGCVDHAEPIDPLTSINTGEGNQIMLMRVCVIQDPAFPTTGIGLRLPKDSSGGYGLLAATAFVNEP